MYSIVKNEKTTRTHFNSKGHDHLDMRVTVVEKVIPNTTNYRLEREDWWIKTLKTKTPKGLNKKRLTSNDDIAGNGRS